MKAFLLALAAATALVLSAGQPADAAFSFAFNQAGTGAPGVQINGFNESAGNALAQGGDLAIANFKAGGPAAANNFDLYFQTTIGNLIDANGNPIGITGQLTAVGHIVETVTSVTGTSATFQVAAGQPIPSLSLYSNPTSVANAMFGTGFITGAPILTAQALPSLQGTLNNFTVAPVPPGTEPALDQLTPPSAFFAGIKSVNGSGVSTVDFKVLTTDPLFFPGGGPGVFTLHLGNAGTNVPFTAVHPSFMFMQPLGGTVFPNVGSINGLTGNDILLQTSGTITANAVPEPSSLALMGLGLAGVFAVARRKRAAQVA